MSEVLLWIQEMEKICFSDLHNIMFIFNSITHYPMRRTIILIHNCFILLAILMYIY